MSNSSTKQRGLQQPHSHEALVIFSPKTGVNNQSGTYTHLNDRNDLGSFLGHLCSLLGYILDNILSNLGNLGNLNLPLRCNKRRMSPAPLQ